MGHSLVLERLLLIQLGGRLRLLRKAQGISTVEMSARVRMSRATLSAVEAGAPGVAIGTYLRVMSVLGIGGDLVFLASDVTQPGPAGSAATGYHQTGPAVQVTVTADSTRHQIQDLQSLALHEAAIRLIRDNPTLLARAQATLDRWRGKGQSRSSSLWDEWNEILRDRKWRKVLSRTSRAQELRQASPLPTVLPEKVRQKVLKQIQDLKQGVTIGDDMQSQN